MNQHFPFDLHDDVKLTEVDKRGELGTGTVVSLSITLTGIFVSVAWGQPGGKSYRRTIERPGNLRRA